MSGYTIGEIIIWLLLAAILGFILGWLLRSRNGESEHVTAERLAAEPTLAGTTSASSTQATLVGGTPAKKSPAKTAAKKAPAKKAPAKKVVAGRFAGSAKPLSGGRAPSAEYKIKGNEDSMIYHTPESPFYGQTIAETWFKTEAAAVAAGFRKPKSA